jgi:hypothetical protein
VPGRLTDYRKKVSGRLADEDKGAWKVKRVGNGCLEG